MLELSRYGFFSIGFRCNQLWRNGGVMVVRSLAARLALWVLSGATLVFVASGFLLFRMVGGQLLEQAHRESGALAIEGSSLIQKRLDKITDTARVLATIVGPRPFDAQPL